MIKNPVLPGFHPDPSMLYHNGVFYIANSTFEYFPGVKISASRDLANWETVCYPLDEPRLLNMKGNPKSCGIWAPCLSFSGGLFYLVYTDTKNWCGSPYKDSPNYITTASDIKGPWSDPVFVNCSGFDPSLFHDDDGRKYFVSMEWDYRKWCGDNEGDQFSGILITELDPVALTPIAEPVKVFRGTERKLVEGPHLYKKDGYYYLFTAEGGTVYTHAEAVARSRSIYGEYELHPEKYLVCAKAAYEKKAPLQKTGHGSMAQSEDGRWWFACLCGRPIDGRCPLGRETAVNELVWENGWPYLKNKTKIMDLEFEGYGEKKPAEKIVYGFKDESFALDFQSLRVKAKHTIGDDGVLRLWGGDSPFCNFEQNMLVRRQMDFSFEAETCLQLHGKSFQQMAGLMYRYDEQTHYFLRASYDDGGNPTLGLICMNGGEFSMPFEIAYAGGKIYLRLTVSEREGVFSYSLDGSVYTEIPYTIDVTTLSDDYAQPLGFTGAYIGMCCVDMRDRTAYADFYEFSYTPL